MSSILDAANANPDKFLMGELPTEPGEVSIMTLEELYNALDDTEGFSDLKWDPTSRYNSSTYHIYGITKEAIKRNGLTLSTKSNIKAVGINWYKELNKPNTADDRWIVNGRVVFGGPLHYVWHTGGDSYDFHWWDSNGHFSSSGDYGWDCAVPGSVYVAVVRAR